MNIEVGLWTFVKEVSNGGDIGKKLEWNLLDLERFENATVMPVPAAYNDLSASASLRDHIGWITVAVNNTLSWATVPQGDFNYMKDSTRNVSGRNLSRTPEGAFKDIGNFDFFNYAGILRSIELIRLSDLTILDIYRQKFGFRTVSWSERQILINDKPFYCLGFGMHEDFEIHGRGYNPVVMTKDLNLLEWMGGNCYRTTHYPYAEERMDEGDRRGIAVVVETPAVGLKGFPKANNLLHMKMLEEMIERDKNHPSVIMWSLANEPHTEKKESRIYFKYSVLYQKYNCHRNLVDYAHALDKTRPVTIVYGPTNFDNDQTVSYTVFEPSIDFSEQYQNDLIMKTHQAFDALRKDHIITGEMIWNFADFMTGMIFVAIYRSKCIVATECVNGDDADTADVNIESPAYVYYFTMSEDGQFEIVDFEDDGALKKDIEIIQTVLVVEMKEKDILANNISNFKKRDVIIEVENLQRKLSEANEKLKEMESNSKAKEMALTEEMTRLKEELREIKAHKSMNVKLFAKQEERKTELDILTWKTEIESHLNEIRKQVEMLTVESGVKNQHESVLKEFTFTYFDNSLIRNIDSTIVTFGRTIYSKDVFCNLFIDDFKSVEFICRKLVEHAFDKQFIVGGFLPVADGLLNRWAELIVIGYSLRDQAGQDERKLADLMWALRKHLKNAVECFWYEYN
uniref:Glyco_hydro_2_C domain-containing protein n=1 Tax=Heterorhabditis bacteriophora TaxID=37862 RepID=A0A1I7XGY4_HETBA